MTDTHSDALVFFGATGDLAYKKIFPSLQAMVKRGHLNIPVVGVAKAGWNLDQMRARIKDAIEKHGGIDTAAFQRLISLVRYIDGDYKDPETFRKLRAELKDAQHPAHYLAIPPSLFETVVEELVKSGCSQGARVIVEKPFGNDLASAQELNRVLRKAFDAEHKALFGHMATDEPVEVVSYRARGVGVVPSVALPQFKTEGRPPSDALVETRPVRFDSATVSSPVYQREKLDVGATLRGPAILDQFDCTTVICVGQTARVDRWKNLIVTQDA